MVGRLCSLARKLKKYKLTVFVIDDATACRLNNLQEIDRREREAARIAALPLDEQDVAIQEEIQRQNDYTSGQFLALHHFIISFSCRFMTKPIKLKVSLCLCRAQEPT